MMAKADAWFPKSIAGDFCYNTVQTRRMSLLEAGKLAKIVFRKYSQIIHCKKGRAISFLGIFVLNFRYSSNNKNTALFVCQMIELGHKEDLGVGV
jgi:hypothetical protein